MTIDTSHCRYMLGSVGEIPLLVWEPTAKATLLPEHGTIAISHETNTPETEHAIDGHTQLLLEWGFTLAAFEPEAEIPSPIGQLTGPVPGVTITANNTGITVHWHTDFMPFVELDPDPTWAEIVNTAGAAMLCSGKNLLTPDHTLNTKPDAVVIGIATTSELNKILP